MNGAQNPSTGVIGVMLADEKARLSDEMKAAIKAGESLFLISPAQSASEQLNSPSPAEAKKLNLARQKTN